MATEITDNHTTLLDLVKALGEYLTSEEDELRTKSEVTDFDAFVFCPYALCL